MEHTAKHAGENDGEHALDVVLPTDADLPGRGWLALDDGFAGPGGVAGEGAGVAELFDCVGPDFPGGDEVEATAATPHYLCPPGRLIHGFGLAAATDDAADRAERVLSGAAFVECLGRSVAADLDASDDAGELLTVDVERTGAGGRVRFAGGTGAGISAVQLDVVCLRHGRKVGVLWFADTPGPFPPADLDHVVSAIRARAS